LRINSLPGSDLKLPPLKVGPEISGATFLLSGEIYVATPFPEMNACSSPLVTPLLEQAISNGKQRRIRSFLIFYYLEVDAQQVRYR
jgi:hypothetical protein